MLFYWSVEPLYNPPPFPLPRKATVLTYWSDVAVSGKVDGGVELQQGKVVVQGVAVIAGVVNDPLHILTDTENRKKF